MSQIITVGNKKYTAELAWNFATSIKEVKGEAKSLIKENKEKYKKADFAVLVKTELSDQVSYGIIDGKSKGNSIAAYFANANAKSISTEDSKTTWYMIEETDENKYWVGGASNGLVLADTDIVYDSLEEVADKFANTFSFWDSEKWDDVAIYCSSQEVANMISALGARVDPIIAPFAERISGVKYTAKQIKITGIDYKYIGMILGVIAVAGAYYGYQKYMEQERIKEARRKQEQAQRDRENSLEFRKQQLNEQINKAIEDARKRAKQIQEEAIKPPHFSKTIDAWEKIITGLEANERNWGRDNIICEYTTTVPNCEVMLTRTELGTNKELVKYIPKATIIGDNATYNVKGDILQEVQRSLEQVNDADYFRIETISKSQRLPFGYGIEVKEVEQTKMQEKVDLPPVPNDLRSEVNLVDHIDIGLSKGQLIFTGVGLDNLKVMKNVFDDNDMVFAKHIKLSGLNGSMNQRPQDASWEIQANFYTRDKESENQNLDIKTENTENTTNPTESHTDLDLN